MFSAYAFQLKIFASFTTHFPSLISSPLRQPATALASSPFSSLRQPPPFLFLLSSLADIFDTLFVDEDDFFV
jgi:hypothetical protein